MATDSVHTDGPLLELLRNGDEAAFTELYHHYSGQLYVNLFKMVKDETLAEEIVQDIFTRIWQKRQTLQVEQSFPAYLYRMGHNAVHDFYRKLQRDRRLYQQFKALATEHYTHIEEALFRQESKVLLHQALDTLSPQQKKAYELCKLEGCSYKETAEQMGISPLTVKEYMVKANWAVRDYLDRHPEVTAGLLFWVLFHTSV